MPIREFTCTKCGEQFERIFLSRSDYDTNAESECPLCAGAAHTDDDVPLVARRNPDHGIQR